MEMTKTMQKRFLEISSSRNYKAAVAFQNEIAELIPGQLSKLKIDRVCGLDISYNKLLPQIYAAATVFSFPGLTLLEEATSLYTTKFPYIPGFLAYREGPALLQVVRKLKSKIDLIILDGHGMAHPRRAGLASIVGLLLDKPTIGCAKSKLVGKYVKPDEPKGSTTDLVHEGRIIGRVLRSRIDIKPIFISVGYKITLNDAVKLALKMCIDVKTPIPVQRAHVLSNIARQQALKRRSA
jgi:deoxyribonuclease V